MSDFSLSASIQASVGVDQNETGELQTFLVKSHNFGDVHDNQTLTCTFPYSGVFPIASISVSCGCTAVSTKEEVMEKGVLLVQWNIGIYGPDVPKPMNVYRTVGVTYDIPDSPTEQLSMYATVIDRE